MAKTRSPNYPSVPLAEAIRDVTTIHQQDLRNRMTPETVVAHLGYSSVNGRSLGKIAALRAYGLLEGRGEELRVSEEAVNIIAEPETSPERRKALRTAAFRPRLFAELYEFFEGRRPSDASLRSQLLKREFTHEAAEKAAAVYLDNWTLVSPEPADYLPSAGFTPVESPSVPAQLQATPPSPTPGKGVTLTVGPGQVSISGTVDAEGLRVLRKKLDMAQDMLDLDKGSEND